MKPLPTAIEDKSVSFFLFCFQTLLENIKRMFAINYKGIPFEKIHPTVGMNGESAATGIIDCWKV